MIIAGGELKDNLPQYQRVYLELLRKAMFEMRFTFSFSNPFSSPKDPDWDNWVDSEGKFFKSSYKGYRSNMGKFLDEYGQFLNPIDVSSTYFSNEACPLGN